MKLFRPMSIGYTELADSTVPDATSPLYVGATTYSTGYRVRLETGTTHHVYESLQDGNTGNTPDISPSWWQYVWDTYAPYSGLDTYALGDVVISNQNEFESLQNANTGNSITDNAWWLDRGAANRWRMFNQSLTSQTEQQKEIVVSIDLVGRNDSVALLNIEADSIQIVLEDAIDEVIYDSGVVSMLDPAGVDDWYQFFFEPIEWKTDYALIGQAAMPLYANAALTVTLSRPNGTARCGALVVGMSKYLGATQYGVGIGIEDYSLKQTDAFGNVTIVERAHANIADFQLWVDNTQVDTLVKLLAGYRATPIYWVGTEQHTSTHVYGYFRDFDVGISYPTTSICSLSIRGLT